MKFLQKLGKQKKIRLYREDMIQKMSYPLKIEQHILPEQRSVVKIL